MVVWKRTNDLRNLFVWLFDHLPAQSSILRRGNNTRDRLLRLKIWLCLLPVTDELTREMQRSVFFFLP